MPTSIQMEVVSVFEQTPVAQTPVAQTPVAHSPVRQRPPLGEHGGWEVSLARSSAALRLSDLTCVAKVLVLSDDASSEDWLGCGFGRTHRRDPGNLVVGSGPGEWLIFGPPATADELCSELSKRPEVSVIDLTHGGFVLRLTGAEGPSLLAKLCAIDLSDRVVGNGACFRSSVARVVCDVVRDDLDDVRSYLIHGDRSAGQYLFDALLQAGAEFGIDVDGYRETAIADEKSRM